MKLILCNHKAYNWQNKCNVTYRGEAFFRGTLYKGDELGALLSSWTKENVLPNVSDCNGNFSFIFDFKGTIFIFSDKIMSFPLLWTKYNDEVYISDNIKCFPQKDNWSKFGLIELFSFGYTLGEKTIIKDVCSLRGADI